MTMMIKRCLYRQQKKLNYKNEVKDMRKKVQGEINEVRFKNYFLKLKISHMNIQINHLDDRECKFIIVMIVMI